ncbi:MAG: hypothetical protein LBU89_11935 [Fibromonadaceae bacterium]|nr:hypothetical protein [Fibromonadaceae bacterium]
MRKVILATSVLFALTFTLSCSDDSGGDDDKTSMCPTGTTWDGTQCSSNPNKDGSCPSGTALEDGKCIAPPATGDDGYSRIYTLKDVEENSFIFVTKEDYYYCEESGLEVEEDIYEEQAEYSIDNRVLTVRWDEWSDTEYNFNGNQNVLTGTWTRNKNKDAHCKEVYDRYDDEYYTECSDYYEVTKAVFTPNTLTLTYDFCIADEIRSNREYRGWAIKAVDCKTLEYSKGTQKMTLTFINPGSYGADQKATYNGKTCFWSREHPHSDRTSACQKANIKFQQEKTKNNNLSYWCRESYYYDFLEEDFEKCLKNNGFPEDFLGNNDDEGCYESSSGSLTRRGIFYITPE